MGIDSEGFGTSLSPLLSATRRPFSKTCEKLIWAVAASLNTPDSVSVGPGAKSQSLETLHRFPGRQRSWLWSTGSSWHIGFASSWILRGFEVSGSRGASFQVRETRQHETQAQSMAGGNPQLQQWLRLILTELHAHA